MTDQGRIETLERLKRQCDMAIDLIRRGRLRHFEQCPTCGPSRIIIGDFQIVDLKARREESAKFYAPGHGIYSSLEEARKHVPEHLIRRV